MPDVLNMDYVSFYSLKGSIDRNKAMERLLELQAKASVQGDGKGYKSLIKQNEDILNPKEEVTPEQLIENVKGKRDA